MKPVSVSPSAAKKPEKKLHCNTTADFLSRPARRRIFELIPTFFVNNAVTVTETLHRGDLLIRLQDTDMVLQQAIQRTAIEITGETPIQDTITDFSKVVMTAINKVKADKKAHIFPHPAEEGFLACADRLAGQPQGLYLLNGALAGYLQNTRSWNEKIDRLSAILQRCPPNTDPAHPGAKMLHRAIDEILAEIVLMPSNLPELIGQVPYLENLIAAKARLFLGQPVHGAYGAGEGLDRLAAHFAAGELPLTHICVGERLLYSIASQKPLNSGKMDIELKSFYRLVQLVRKCAGPHLPLKRLRQILELRSARFTKPGTLRQVLATTILPDEKIAKLFFIAACIIDARGRYAIADMIFRFATADSFAQRFSSAQIPLTRRLHRLAELNRFALKASFDRDQCQRMARIFDEVAFAEVEKNRLFELIRSQRHLPAEKLMTLYKLVAAGAVTEGKFAQKLRAEATFYVLQPDFLAGYRKIRKTDGTQQALWTDLREKLTRIGLEPNAIVKKLAV